jgi:hypothetical protein
MAIKNSAPNPITVKGQRAAQFTLRKIWPANDSKPKTMSIAPPISVPALERFVCISFSFQRQLTLAQAAVSSGEAA